MCPSACTADLYSDVPLDGVESTPSSGTSLVLNGARTLLTGASLSKLYTSYKAFN